MSASTETAIEIPTPTSRRWELKELSPRHKQAAALLAQGVRRGDIAQILDITPEYVSWLCRDPLFVGYLRDMTAVTEVRLEALFDQAVDVIADGMHSSNTPEDRLKAARLQLEATKRIGRNEPQVAAPASGRLEQLAERLTSLLRDRREGRTIEGDVHEVNPAAERGGQEEFHRGEQEISLHRAERGLEDRPL